MYYIIYVFFFGHICAPFDFDWIKKNLNNTVLLTFVAIREREMDGYGGWIISIPTRDTDMKWHVSQGHGREADGGADGDMDTCANGFTYVCNHKHANVWPTWAPHRICARIAASHRRFSNGLHCRAPSHAHVTLPLACIYVQCTGRCNVIDARSPFVPAVIERRVVGMCAPRLVLVRLQPLSFLPFTSSQHDTHPPHVALGAAPVFLFQSLRAATSHKKCSALIILLYSAAIEPKWKDARYSTCARVLCTAVKLIKFKNKRKPKKNSVP